jgi:hypothetical protein
MFEHDNRKKITTIIFEKMRILFENVLKEEVI